MALYEFHEGTQDPEATHPVHYDPANGRTVSTPEDHACDICFRRRRCANGAWDCPCDSDL
jgi:hypothetical protein